MVLPVGCSTAVMLLSPLFGIRGSMGRPGVSAVLARPDTLNASGMGVTLAPTAAAEPGWKCSPGMVAVWVAEVEAAT